MRIVINATGKTEEVSAKVASRLINKGRAHYPEKQVGGIVDVPIKLHDDLIIPPETKKKLEELKASEGVSEPVEVELGKPVKEIDLIEPIPERFTEPEVITKPKTWKPKKRSKKRR